MEVELQGGPLPVRHHPFPAEWGPPPPLEQRTAWIIRNIRTGEVRARRGEHVSWLPPEASRPLSGQEALWRLNTRLRNENRLRMVEVLAKATP